jgi:DNA-binding beta-propeller fold protein YncE
MTGIIIGLVLAFQVSADQPVWSVSGLKTPESVEYDSIRNQYYVSNVNGDPMMQDSNGSIALINGEGQLVNVDWITGLHGPKGLALHNNKLYVADIRQVVVINVVDQKVVARYEAADSMMLNGITVSKTGDVFVSDMMGNRIYTLDNGELKIWLENPELNSPNGLWVEDNYLYVASWGSKPKKDMTTETSGNIKKISLKHKSIETLDQKDSWVNMDGISRYSSSHWLVSDFLKGKVLSISQTGEVKDVLTLKPGSADLFYVREKSLLVVPLFMDGKVVAYKLQAK